MGKFAKDLIEGMTEAVAHAEGKSPASSVHTVDVPDVRAIRHQLAPSAARTPISDVRDAPRANANIATFPYASSRIIPNNPNCIEPPRYRVWDRAAANPFGPQSFTLTP